MEGKIRCRLCSELFSEAHNLEAHIATSHIYYTPYECEFCGNALFPTDRALRDHYKNIHNIKYRVNPELEKRKEMLDQLMLDSTNLTLKEQQQQNAPYGAFASQLLKTCTTQLLREQLTKTELFPANILNNHFGPSTSDSSSVLNENQKQFLHDPKPLFGHLTQNELICVGSMNGSEDNFINSSIAKQNGSKKRVRRKINSDGSIESKMEMNGEEEKVTMVECIDCKRKVGKYRNSMLIHTSTHHCDQPIFECTGEGCDKKWYSLSARTKEHIESKHGGNYSLLKDNRAVLMPMMKAKTSKLFPDYYSLATNLRELLQ
uniref:C2H2-type domain-containing protein n=1 Tax=Meloidogyne javanica TaxID=6303 RepID=A0A915N971_MELJA